MAAGSFEFFSSFTGKRKANGLPLSNHSQMWRRNAFAGFCLLLLTGCTRQSVETQAKNPQPSASAIPKTARNNGIIDHLKVTKDGRNFVLTRWFNGKDGGNTTIEVWDAKKLVLRKTWNIPGHVYAFDLHHDSKTVAFSVNGRNSFPIQLWELNGQKLGAYEGRGSLALAFTNHGKWLAVGDVYDLRWLDWKTGKEMRRAKPWKVPFFINKMEASSDGNTIGVTQYDAGVTVSLWDSKKGAPKFKLGPGNGIDLAFSPRGDVVLGECGGLPMFFSTATGKELATLEAGEDVINFEFSPDGQFVVYATWTFPDHDGIHVWDWKRKKLVRTLPLNGPARFLKDGKTFVCTDKQSAKLVFLPMEKVTQGRN